MRAPSAGDDELIWHDIECGAYGADLELWDQLIDEQTGDGAAATVLDIGAGTGRVTLALAQRGHKLTALDNDPQLLGELARRARKRGLRIRTTTADARDFDLGKRFDVVLAPMQLVQLLGGEAGRKALFDCVAQHLLPGGLFATALLDLSGEPTDAAYEPPLPDVGEHDGWVYSSLPVAVRTLDRGRAIALERLRKTVSPDGEISEQHNTIKLRLVGPDKIEREAASAGLRAAGRITIDATDDHVGSVVVMLRS